MKYENAVFKEATIENANAIRNIIVERSKWLKCQNIRQWESFFERGISYYIDKINNEKVYVVLIEENICATFILQTQDQYWNKSDNALYIHHFAVKIGYPGLGKDIIKYIKNVAIKNKKDYIRLDHLKENEKLGNYYEKLGFEKKREIQEENYNCILREMKL